MLLDRAIDRRAQATSQCRRSQVHFRSLPLLGLHGMTFSHFRPSDEFKSFDTGSSGSSRNTQGKNYKYSHHKPQQQQQ